MSATLTFRQAEPEDLPAAQELYRRIIEHAARTGDQARWFQYDHPSADEVTHSLNRGYLYVIECKQGSLGETALVAAGVLNQEATPGYENVSWPSGASADESLVLHTLGVDPTHLRRGVARFYLDEAAALAAKMGLVALRLETFADNYPALALYRGYGFTDVGKHRLSTGGLEHEHFQLFELAITQSESE